MESILKTFVEINKVEVSLNGTIAPHAGLERRCLCSWFKRKKKPHRIPKCFRTLSLKVQYFYYWTKLQLQKKSWTWGPKDPGKRRQHEGETEQEEVHVSTTGRGSRVAGTRQLLNTDLVAAGTWSWAQTQTQTETKSSVAFDPQTQSSKGATSNLSSWFMRLKSGVTATHFPGDVQIRFSPLCPLFSCCYVVFPVTTALYCTGTENKFS